MNRLLPNGFVEMIKGYNSKWLDGLLDALESSDAVTSVRLNQTKADSGIPPSISDLIDNSVPWTPRAYYLKSRPRFTLDPAFHQGLYYVQDASSMFISQAISTALRHFEHSRPITYLDACAAPGGKTTAAIDSIPDNSIVIANEFVPARAAVLVENLVKWGYPNLIVTRGDTAPLGQALRGLVDIVAADLPCSGEGMMRKEPDAITQWSPRLIMDTAALQREIVSNLWDAIKPGGFLIYSTCTFNRTENEENLQWILDNFDAEPVEIDISKFPDIAPGLDTQNPCYRFLPSRLRGEGLFLALIHKRGDNNNPPSRQRRKSAKVADKQQRSVAPLNDCRKWLVSDSSFEIKLSHNDDKIIAATPDVINLREILENNKCRVIYHGVEIAVVKGRDIVPAQSLILSRLFNPESLPAVNVDCDTALDFLSRNTITLPDGMPRGYLLLVYDSRPLGIVKNIGNRCNNLYPSSWRILHR